MVNSSVNTLSLEWEGHHKEMFISDANPHQKKGVTSIEYLKRQENFFSQPKGHPAGSLHQSYLGNVHKGEALTDPKRILKNKSSPVQGDFVFNKM
jgi:hypothetical protein